MKFDVIKPGIARSKGLSAWEELRLRAARELAQSADENPHPPSNANSPAYHPFGGGRLMHINRLIEDERGLDTVGFCPVHEIQLTPLEYYREPPLHESTLAGFCPRCDNFPAKDPPIRPIRCVYCLEHLSGLYTPCLCCGCIFHDACLVEWHAAGETECPAGDECNCIEEAMNGKIESWPAMQAALVTMLAEAKEVERYVTAARSKREAMRLRRKSVPASVHAGSSSSGGGFGKYAGYVDEFENEEGWGVSSMVRWGARSFRRGSSSRNSRDVMDGDEWETVGSGSGIPYMSGALGTGGGGGGGGSSSKPAPRGNEPISAARLSLGTRLRKSLVGDSSRPGAPRRKSGGVGLWRTGAL
jgi:hypothetical protein